MGARRQLTLFLEGEPARLVEAVRCRFNPQQQALIACHVTLCREDELVDPDLANLGGPLMLRFGRPVRFSDGRGVLLPATGGIEAFHALRTRILGTARPHEPHITLMHPRNSTCDDAAFAALSATSLPDEITFRRVSLIEQLDGGPWSWLRDHSLSPG